MALLNVTQVATRLVEATKGNIFFTADRDYWVKSIRIIKSGDSAATEIMVEKLNDGDVAGAGTDLLAAAQDLSTTPDNRKVYDQTLTPTLAERQILAGQSLGTNTVGVTNTVVGEVLIQVTLASTSDAAKVG